jgi:ribosomal protein L4
VRNLPAVILVASNRLTAREVMNAHQLVATRAALERLQEALA